MAIASVFFTCLFHTPTVWLICIPVRTLYLAKQIHLFGCRFPENFSTTLTPIIKGFRPIKQTPIYNILLSAKLGQTFALGSQCLKPESGCLMQGHALHRIAHGWESNRVLWSTHFYEQAFFGRFVQPMYWIWSRYVCYI